MMVFASNVECAVLARIACPTDRFCEGDKRVELVGVPVFDGTQRRHAVLEAVESRQHVSRVVDAGDARILPTNTVNKSTLFIYQGTWRVFLDKWTSLQRVPSGCTVTKPSPAADGEILVIAARMCTCRDVSAGDADGSFSASFVGSSQYSGEYRLSSACALK